MRKRKKRIHYKYKLGLKEKLKDFSAYIKVDEPKENIDANYIHVEIEIESESREVRDDPEDGSKARDSVTKI